jgi:signal transduction histidine kinase
MRIAHRIYLTVLPAVLGVPVVAALAYGGQYPHRERYLVVIVAACASVGTLVLAWANARHVAQCVERLADSAVLVAESGDAEKEREPLDRTRDYAAIMASVAEDVAKRIEEIRLPLHILLENRFGELNENQEEMLSAARTAADAADVEVLAMQRLADIDCGTLTLRRDRILPGDLLQSLLPTLQAQADQQGLTLHVEIEPLLPAIHGDQAQLQESLSTLLSETMLHAQREEMEVRLEKAHHGCELIVRGGGVIAGSVRTALATRLIGTMGGRIHHSAGDLHITLVPT